MHCIKKFVESVKREGSQFAGKAEFKSLIKRMKAFFQADNELQSYDQFSKFLDYYYKFLLSRQQEQCELCVAMMKTILGEDITE